MLKQFILDHGEKITKNEVIEGIRTLVGDYFKDKTYIKPIYINLPTDKIGSEHWVYLNVKDLLPEHKVVLDEYDDVDIFFIDDWVLSGCNACANLENILYNLEVKNSRYTILSYVGTGNNSNINGLKRRYRGVTIEYHSAKRVYLLSEKLNMLGITVYQKEFDQFHIKYNPDTECESYLVYSDYKIPNGFGSYPLIYTDPIDRDFMKEVIAQF